MSKYDMDGHLEVIDPSRLKVGNVVRYTYGDGGMPTFSDSVITSIRSMNEGRYSHNILQDALRVGDVEVHLARPFLSADGSGSWCVSVENYRVSGNRLLSSHKVVVQSTGEYASHCV